MVYAPVGTFANHKQISYDTYYYKFRYERNNIVVARILSPALSRDFGLAQKLESAVRPYLRSHCNHIGTLVDRAWDKLRNDNRDINVRFMHGLKINKYRSFGFLLLNEYETRFNDARTWWDKRVYVRYFEHGYSCKVAMAVIALPR